MTRGGRAVTTETVVYGAGARALVLVTTSAELLCQLYSSYVGDEGLEHALVSEAAESPGSSVPELRSRRIEVGHDFLAYRRDQALLDHLERFCALVAESGVEIEVGDVTEARAVLSPLAA